MEKYKISETAKEDLIRIHQYGLKRYGEKQADKYFESMFDYFEIISENPYIYESVEYIRSGYRRCPCGSDTIYYRITKVCVEIMAIIGKQDVKKALKR